MKKICLLLSFVMLLTGCSMKLYHWDFDYTYVDIRSIRIVDVGDNSNSFDINDLNTLMEVDISLAKNVYNDILDLKMKRYGTNLASPYGKCFLIEYKNGEFDLVSQKEPRHFRYENGKLTSYTSWLYCDEKEFNELINKYLQEK